MQKLLNRLMGVAAAAALLALVCLLLFFSRQERTKWIDRLRTVVLASSGMSV